MLNLFIDPNDKSPIDFNAKSPIGPNAKSPIDPKAKSPIDPNAKHPIETRVKAYHRVPCFFAGEVGVETILYYPILRNADIKILVFI